MHCTFGVVTSGIIVSEICAAWTHFCGLNCLVHFHLLAHVCVAGVTLMQLSELFGGTAASQIVTGKPKMILPSQKTGSLPQVHPFASGVHLSFCVSRLPVQFSIAFPYCTNRIPPSAIAPWKYPTFRTENRVFILTSP